ncbi:hypothetical protein [Enterovirga rhinocerotis]|uniref:Uncharacterized protein n=1 Tax=Enterovirga rhinocerotis TaxID=1339210 RepID=A0A4R7BYC1_9HYPH|nr:hypothetical protein [Enterovirga rhinocerotis]TDR90252.1 hypothetical protein EV668_3094 [Enterovirga rhinocerotis]
MTALHDPIGDPPDEKETAPRANAGPDIESNFKNDQMNSTPMLISPALPQAVSGFQRVATAAFAVALAAGYDPSTLDAFAERSIDIGAGVNPAKYKRRIAFASGVREGDWRFGAPPPGRSHRERSKFADLILELSKTMLSEMPRQDVERIIFAALAEAKTEARDV